MEPMSSGQHVLMKDQSKIKKAIRHTTIVVNSRDRNYLSYPNSNHFRWTLRRPLTNVMSVELMNGSVPAFLYTIQPEWGSFSFREWKNLGFYGETSTVVTITLRPGYYTEVELCEELENQLNSIDSNKNTYCVTLNINTRRLTISVVSSSEIYPYSLLFYSGDRKDEINMTTLAMLSINTPARLLGFGLNDYVSNSENVIIAPLPMDLDNFLNRMYLYIDADGKNLSRMELGAGRDDCFHIFYIDANTRSAGGYLLLDKETDHSVYTSSPAPIARIANLEISLRDEFNRFIDLNHREMNLVFEITHLE